MLNGPIIIKYCFLNMITKIDLWHYTCNPSSFPCNSSCEIVVVCITKTAKTCLYPSGGLKALTSGLATRPIGTCLLYMTLDAPCGFTRVSRDK